MSPIRRVAAASILTRVSVMPGHEIPDVEEVVERTEAYEVVCKNRGLGKAVAQLTDPRS
jgi:hypothetical protein